MWWACLIVFNEISTFQFQPWYRAALQKRDERFSQNKQFKQRLFLCGQLTNLVFFEPKDFLLFSIYRQREYLADTIRWTATCEEKCTPNCRHNRIIIRFVYILIWRPHAPSRTTNIFIEPKNDDDKHRGCKLANSRLFLKITWQDNGLASSIETRWIKSGENGALSLFVVAVSVRMNNEL